MSLMSDHLLDERVIRLFQMMHLIFSKFEVDRGYGGDLPASPYMPILAEIEDVMNECGVKPIPQEMRESQRTLSID